jgi:hypothetical protein
VAVQLVDHAGFDQLALALRFFGLYCLRALVGDDRLASVCARRWCRRFDPSTLGIFRRLRERGRLDRLCALKGTSVILVPNQYKRIGCSPGKHPDTRTMATRSDDDSRDSVHDRVLCIAV